MNKIKSINNKEFIKKSISLIIKSLLYEVSCYPSPGLISPISNGAHNDMNYYTFIDSISEISPDFEKILELGMSSIPTENLLDKIRPIGITIENKMFNATNNINTHKGLIFLTGIVSVSVSRAFSNNLDFSYIQNIIKKVCCNLVNKELLNNNNNKTYGEIIFKKYNITGIRGEVEKGLPTVFNYSLPFFKKNKYLPTNEKLYTTLICIMAHCEDSTLLHRHNLDVLKEVNSRCKKILKLINHKDRIFIRNEILLLDKEFSKRNISPGGSADLLAITVFLEGISNFFQDTQK